MPDTTTRPAHPSYGTCGGCRQLKHVRANGLLRDHNRFLAVGTLVSARRCSGSARPYLEAPARV